MSSLDEQLYEWRRRADIAEGVLASHGFVRCYIAACNCGSWHHRYGLAERFREIIEALEEADVNLNGVTVLAAIKKVLAERKS